MTDTPAKADLRADLQMGRDAMLWKLEGLSDYDMRRPMTPTGTNLLGLVKHVSYVEMGYFGAVFGRPIEEARPWIDDEGEPNWDMCATVSESCEQIVGLYHRAWAHADATIDRLPLGRARPGLLVAARAPGGDPPPDPRTRHRRDPPARRSRGHRPRARRRGHRPARGQLQPAAGRPGVVGELPEQAEAAAKDAAG
jgi:hypothetical protein